MSTSGLEKFARATAHTALAAGIFGTLLISVAVTGNAWGYMEPDSAPGLVFAGAAICVTGLFSAATFLTWRLFDRRLPGAGPALAGGVLCLLGLLAMIPFLPRGENVAFSHRSVPGPNAA